MSRILIIDDDIRLRNSMGGALNAHGHASSVCGTLSEAKVLVKDADVVICDWDLGFYEVLNGGEIVTQLRKEHPNVRYIIWSGLDRVVPDGVEFFSKAGLTEILEALGEP